MGETCKFRGRIPAAVHRSWSARGLTPGAASAIPQSPPPAPDDFAHHPSSSAVVIKVRSAGVSIATPRCVAISPKTCRACARAFPVADVAESSESASLRLTSPGSASHPPLSLVSASTRLPTAASLRRRRSSGSAVFFTTCPTSSVVSAGVPVQPTLSWIPGAAGVMRRSDNPGHSSVSSSLIVVVREREPQARSSSHARSGEWYSTHPPSALTATSPPDVFAVTRTVAMAASR